MLYVNGTRWGLTYLSQRSFKNIKEDELSVLEHIRVWYNKKVYY